MTEYNNKSSISGGIVDEYSIDPHLLEILKLAIDNEEYGEVKKLVVELHAADIAELISILHSERREGLVISVEDIFDPEILVYLDGDVKEEVINLLGAKESARAINELDSDDGIQVIEDLEKKDQYEILNQIPKEKRDEIREGLAHPEESAGRRMDRSFVSIPQDWTVGKTIDYLREESDLPDDFYSIFIVDKKSAPIGSTLVSRVMRNKRDVKIADIMDKGVKAIELGTDQEDVAHIFQKYALASAPIVDESGAMTGIISIDDVVDIIHEEAEEDIMRLGGVAETDIYSKSMKTAFHRFPWLFINLLTAIAASAVIALFDYAIEKIVALAILMPIVASMAGNAGTQTLTVAVRALATKELTKDNAWRVVGKEVLASVANGAMLGVIVGGACYLYYGDVNLSLIFTISVFLSLVIAALFGALIPLALTRFGIDPAISSGVFLTTVTDISGFFIFLGLAALMLV